MSQVCNVPAVVDDERPTGPEPSWEDALNMDPPNVLSYGTQNRKQEWEINLFLRRLTVYICSCLFARLLSVSGVFWFCSVVPVRRSLIT